MSTRSRSSSWWVCFCLVGWLQADTLPVELLTKFTLSRGGSTDISRGVGGLDRP